MTTASTRQPTVMPAGDRPAGKSPTRKLLARDRWLDRTGVWLSALCMVHCLALPFLLLALPTLRPTIESVAGPWVHIALAIVLPLVALIALAGGFRSHRQILPVALGLLGAGFIVFAVLDPSDALSSCCAAHSEAKPQEPVTTAGLALPAIAGESIATSVGSLLLIAGHLLNARLAGRCAGSCRAC